MKFKLPWREAGPPNHHDNKVDADQEVDNTELSPCMSLSVKFTTGSFSAGNGKTFFG